MRMRFITVSTSLYTTLNADASLFNHSIGIKNVDNTLVSTASQRVAVGTSIQGPLGSGQCTFGGGV